MCVCLCSTASREVSSLTAQLEDGLDQIWNELESNGNSVAEPYAATKDCECGLANQKNKIVGGEVTVKNEYPWLVSLHTTIDFLLRGASQSHFCGGALISSRYVITAAHCTVSFVSAPLSLTVGIGRHDLTSLFDSWTLPRVAIRVINHPDYNRATQDNDVALIKLLLPVGFSETIRPVCLTGANVDFTSKSLVVAGWGATDEGGAASSQLQDVSIVGVSNEECSSKYASSKVDITANMLCAAVPEGGKDSCQGDSGGPLTYKCGDRFNLIGIVSFGIGCGQAQFPGVYTRFSSVAGWVDKIIGNDTACGIGCNDV